MTASFDLLHISDLHIASKSNIVNPFSFFKADGKRQERERSFDFKVKLAPSSYDPRALRILIGTINSPSFHSLDLVIITGDLSTTGMDEDLAPAAALLGNTIVNPPLQKTMLSSLISNNIPISVLPGNHDRYKNNTGKPGSDNFETFFKTRQPNFNWLYWKGDFNGRFHYNILTEGAEKLIIVSIDLSLTAENICNKPRRIFQYGQGKLTEDMEELIIKYTNAVKKTFKTEAVIWCVHFPPHNKYKELKLLRGSKLLDCAKLSGVEHIMCGHSHENSEYTKKGVTVHVVGTPCGADEAVHDFQRFKVKVKNNKISSLSKRRYACLEKDTWFNEY